MQIFRASLVLTLFCLGWGGNFDNELSSTILDIRSFKFSYSLSTTLQLLRLYLCRVDILPGGKKNVSPIAFPLDPFHLNNTHLYYCSSFPQPSRRAFADVLLLRSPPAGSILDVQIQASAVPARHRRGALARLLLRLCTL